MTNEDGQQSLSDIIGIFVAATKRYWRIALAPAIAAFLLTCFGVYRLPNFYEADVLVHIQPQRVTSKLFEPEHKEEKQERMEALMQEILSRPRLRAIIDRFELFPSYRGVIGKQKAVEKFKNKIQIEQVRSQTGSSTLLQTFRLSFADRDAKKAYEVTKALSNLFIEESVVNRRSEIQGTEEFLDAQLDAARRKLEGTEEAVQKFVRQNFGKLPEHLDQAGVRLQNAQAQIASNSQLISANLSRRNYLEKELELVKSTPNPATGGGLNAADPYEGLAQLESALVVLKSKYSDKHPDVVNTEKRIEALRTRLKEAGASGGVKRPTGLGSTNPNAIALGRELNELDVQIASLNKENENLRQMVSDLQNDIKVMPLKEQELIKLKRDYDNDQKNYERLLSEKENVNLQASLVRSQKASQFRIVEPPEFPVLPAGPPRKTIIAAGFGASIVIFLLVPIAMFFLTSSYKASEEVENDLGVPVIGVIPPMDTPELRQEARMVLFRSLIGAMAAVGVGSVVIATVL